MVDAVVIQGGLTRVNCTIYRDADWSDPLPPFLEGEDPYDLTDAVIEIYIRPTFDHDTRIKLLSTATGEIVVDDVTGGIARIYVERGEVITDLPIGIWDWFCVLTDADSRIYEVFRGSLTVLPARIV